MGKPHSHQLVEQYIAAYNERDPNRLTEIFAPSVNWNGEEVLRDDLPAGVQLWLDAFPDISLTLHTIVANDDQAAFRFTIRGTHERDFEGIEPTGNTIEVTEMIHITIEDGLINGLWYEWDELGFFDQLDVLEHPLG